MASGVGKWEVVKKGKKQNNSSGGKTQDKKSARKALREANMSHTDTNRKKYSQIQQKDVRMVPHRT